MQVFKHLQEKERERETRMAGGGGGGIGETRVFNKNYRVFSEDISNYPIGVYTVNDSFREKVILFDAIVWK